MIRLTIQRKAFIATFALATTLTLLLILVLRWNLGQSFERYTTAAEFSRLDWLIQNIESEYALHGNWDFVRAAPEDVWRRLSRPRRRAAANSSPGPVGGSGAQLRPDDRDFEPPPPSWEEDRPPPPWARDGPPPRARENAPGRRRMLDGPPDARDQAEGSGQLRPPRPAPGPRDPLDIGPRLALLDVDGTRLAGNGVGTGALAERPITYKGTVVGRLTLQAAPAASQQLDSAFLASQTQKMLLAGLGALVLSLFAAWVLARHLLAPIRAVTAGARRIAEGQLDAHIPVHGDDELGELAENFNEMAQRLASHEQARRGWIVDTSHELRTPLAVLRAEIEAMQDGVRTPDAGALARLHKQVQDLSKLVDDLRLTLDREPGIADMEHVAVSPIEVLHECVDAFRERFATARIALDTTKLADAGWVVRGDAGRLTQVFSNLLENTLRYTQAGGRLRIAARAADKRLVLQFDDTAPAPASSALPHLFERFYRAEPSRSRALGGSGLGLAICKTLVEAHGGRIAAARSDLGGLAIRIELPLGER